MKPNSTNLENIDLTVPALGEDEYYALVKTVHGNSRFTIFLPTFNYEVLAVLKKTAKVGYKFSKNRIAVNSVVLTKYIPAFEKACITKKIRVPGIVEKIIKEYNLELYEQDQL